MTLSIIVAMSENRVIGRDQKLPWNIPADLKRLRALTTGHPIVMGRKTYESIGKPLPNRTNIIITRNKNYSASGCVVVGSMEEALKPYLDTQEEVFIFGGGEIFKQMIHKVDNIYLTLVHQNIEGDTYFPQIDYSQWKEIKKEEHSEPVPFSFIDYIKK